VCLVLAEEKKEIINYINLLAHFIRYNISLLFEVFAKIFNSERCSVQGVDCVLRHFLELSSVTSSIHISTQDFNLACTFGLVGYLCLKI
jgi:hypothetical protein